MLRALEARGVLQHTLVIVAADHGELFGEHGLTGHGNALYTPLLHVPLVRQSAAVVHALLFFEPAPAHLPLVAGHDPLVVQAL